MSFAEFLGELFAGSTTPLGGIKEFAGEKASVSKIFSGINYLQALNSTTVSDLSNHLTTGKFKYFGQGSSADEKKNENANDTNISGSTDSIFNKFTVFAYQNFQQGGSYKPELHFIGAHNTATKLIQDPDDAAKSKESIIASQARLEPEVVNKPNNSASFRKTAAVLANPNVKNIIEWANNTSAISVTGFQPYAMTDFMFCKYYGKIPNNRLITFRRYPFPIDDQIKIRKDGKYHSPIPVAQAVTWFGGDTKNVLSNIGVLNWNMPFGIVNALKGTTTNDSSQHIGGNEILVNDLLKTVDAIPGGGEIAKLLQGLTVALAGNDADFQGYVGTEAKLQKYAELLYTTDGPYWNRIFGPVNVIHQSTQRLRGMQFGWQTEFPLNFHYQFRSFNGLSPKIVALDLISNFLNLTYNDAQFLGQLARYFPKAGLKFNETVNELLGGLLLKGSISLHGNLADSTLKLVAAIKQSISVAMAEAASDFSLTDAVSDIAQLTTIKTLNDAIPRMIPIRSALSDRPVGEWHLVVGNPLNPIMVMGDLICKSCTMVFDEEFGPDDFPTGITFTVKLAQGKPRDKISIERMFNLGESQLAGSILRAPSSANDTFGEANTKLWESLATLKNREALIADKERTATIQAEINTHPAFAKYQNRIRRSYGYNASGEAGDPIQENGAVNDSLLYMYFDKSLERQ